MKLIKTTTREGENVTKLEVFLPPVFPQQTYDRWSFLDEKRDALAKWEARREGNPQWLTAHSKSITGPTPVP
jgi:hypothetical protein